MKDIKEMDIEDIDRHLHNLKLLKRFLKDKKIYNKFKDIFFIKQHRSYVDVIKCIANSNVVFSFIRCGITNDIDRKWAVFFSFKPYSGVSWYDEGLDFDEMTQICREWVDYIGEYNYDKKKDKR